MSNGHWNLLLVSSVPAACFPSGFCVRCLRILYKRTSMLKQCDGKILLYFFGECVVYICQQNKEATEAADQSELGKLENWSHY